MTTSNAVSTDADLIVKDSEFGARRFHGSTKRMVFAVTLAWAFFQLWYASPLPFMFGFGIFNDFEARSIHLTFAFFLAFISFPATKSANRDQIPLFDWALALIGAFCSAYIVLNYQALAERAGVPNEINFDVMVALTGLVLLLEAARRSLGLPLTIIATVLLIYAYAGPYMPDVIAHSGKSIEKIASHQWLSQEGVFGVPLGVSTDFVFLFVLFGAMLARAGAGNWFIQSAFAMLGHLRGGPAKAAVVASAATGIVSGSSIANVATTGTYTIPLMKRIGFPGTKAGAVEVAASTNGQLTPPVMGAAAFIMIEYVGITYLEVIKHAALPAIISYVALVYIVHLEAIKAGMEGIPKTFKTTLLQRLANFFGVISAISLTGLFVYYGVGWVKDYAGEYALATIIATIVLVYMGLIKYSCRFQSSLANGLDDDLRQLPELGPTVKAGLYFLIPLFVLMWCLMVERLSAGLSAFWATLLMAFIVVTQRPLLAYFQSLKNVKPWRQGFDELLESLSEGARNMVPIGIATATAGIVVGTVTLTGIGQVMVELVETISGGHLLLALFFTAIICVLLGMGLPTTANYIVVSSLMAPVIVEIASNNGVFIPLIAVHLFVFYFGILADDTPPVGLAAFVASAIAKADPIKTGVQGFIYDIRTAVLPFMFVFNPQLLMIGISGPFEFVLVVATALVAMLLFAAATQGYWVTKNRFYETILLLLVAFTLFRPEFWWDQLYPPIKTVPAANYEQLLTDLEPGSPVKYRVSGLNLDGDEVTKTISLPLGAGETANERLLDVGMEVIPEGDTLYIDFVTYDSPAHNNHIEMGWMIEAFYVQVDRPPKQLMYLPALLLLGFIYLLQRRRV